jgi:hypothetical protein
MEARKELLLVAVADAARAEPPSLAEQIQLRLQTALGLFGLLVLICASLVAACLVAVSASGSAKRVSELTAATGALTAVALAAPALSRSDAARGAPLVIRLQRQSLAAG